MEAAALISESNWSSFAFEDSELFMSQLFRSNPYPNLHDFDSNVAIPASFSWFSGDQDHASNSDSLCTSWPLDGSNTGHGQDSVKDVCTLEEPNPSSEDLFLVLNEDQCMNAGGEPRIHFPEDIVPHNGLAFSSHKRKFQTSVGDDHSIAEQPAINYQSEINPKKKAKISGHAQRNAKMYQMLSISDEDNVACQNGQSSSSNSSEDDSNASDELHGGGSSSTSKGSMALSLNRKARASRGSATDPQSLYARKRREKINERLRILQNLVPNGTKVDLSTMLEEAVQYVKFLQLQIKLLSSDDLWMYAPIAYNGMNVGFDLKTSPKQ